MKVGIDKLQVYGSQGALDIAALARARGLDPVAICARYLVDERTVCPPWEDTVTLAVNAARGLLTDEERDSIGLLIVGTESSVDQEKPISTWVHRALGLPSRCRNYEVKHACYSGTAALQTAARLLAGGQADFERALIINADQSLMGLGEPYEPVIGGGAVAMLVSRQPRFASLDLERSGVFAQEVADVMRPAPHIETGNGETSLLSYMEGLHGAYDDYLDRVGDVDFDREFAGNVYHVPFGGIAQRAHRALLRRHRDVSSAEAHAHFAARVLPGLTHNRRMGGTYGGSTFIALLGLIDTCDVLHPGDPVGIFAFGAGSCAEFYRVRLEEDARAMAAAADTCARLDGRRCLSVADYERAERFRHNAPGQAYPDPRLPGFEDWYREQYAGRGLYVLDRVDDYVRHYRWS